MASKRLRKYLGYLTPRKLFQWLVGPPRGLRSEIKASYSYSVARNIPSIDRFNNPTITDIHVDFWNSNEDDHIGMEKHGQISINDHDHKFFGTKNSIEIAKKLLSLKFRTNNVYFHTDLP